MAAVFVKYTKGEAAELLLTLACSTLLGDIKLLPGLTRVSASCTPAAETLSVLDSLGMAHAPAGCTAAVRIVMSRRC